MMHTFALILICACFLASGDAYRGLKNSARSANLRNPKVIGGARGDLIRLWGNPKGRAWARGDLSDKDIFEDSDTPEVDGKPKKVKLEPETVFFEGGPAKSELLLPGLSVLTVMIGVGYCLHTGWQLPKVNLRGYRSLYLNTDVDHVSEETALLWIRFLVFQRTKATKGWFTDGHEREDVIRYRNDFLQRMGMIEQKMIKYDFTTQTIPIIPELEEGERQCVLITHDESTFYCNDGRKFYWLENGKQKYLPKTKGASIMISGFMCHCH
jgi:hypothetical protein